MFMCKVGADVFSGNISFIVKLFQVRYKTISLKKIRQTLNYH